MLPATFRKSMRIFSLLRFRLQAMVFALPDGGYPVPGAQVNGCGMGGPDGCAGVLAVARRWAGRRGALSPLTPGRDGGIISLKNKTEGGIDSNQ